MLERFIKVIRFFFIPSRVEMGVLNVSCININVYCCYYAGIKPATGNARTLNWLSTRQGRMDFPGRLKNICQYCVSKLDFYVILIRSIQCC